MQALEVRIGIDVCGARLVGPRERSNVAEWNPVSAIAQRLRVDRGYDTCIHHALWQLDRRLGVGEFDHTGHRVTVIDWHEIRNASSFCIHDGRLIAHDWFRLG